MLENVLLTARETGVLFALMMLGVLARQLRIMDAHAVRKATDFLILIIAPCLILTSFQRSFESSMLVGLGWSFAAGFFFHFTGILLGRIFVRDPDERRRRCLRWATIFANCGFMGLPLEEALFGAEGVFYGVASIAVFNMLAWTYGVALIRGGFRDGESVFALKAILNPAISSLFVALPLFFLPWRLPYVIAQPIAAIGSMNTPLSMVVTGYYLAGANFRLALSSGSSYVMLALRHIAVPAVLIAVFAFCPFIPLNVRLINVIPAAAPIGALLTVFAVRYDGDAEFSTAMVAVSTLLSILTLPLMIAVAQQVFQ